MSTHSQVQKLQEPTVSDIVNDPDMLKLIEVDGGSAAQVKALMARTAREREARGWHTR